MLGHHARKANSINKPFVLNKIYFFTQEIIILSLIKSILASFQLASQHPIPSGHNS